MRLFLITAFILVNSFCFSQRRNIYFLKNNGEYVMVRDSADYIRIVAEPDSGSTLYNFSEYYLNGKAKRLGFTSVIDPPKFEGTCTEFYKSGKRQSVTDYKNGNVFGLEYDYYPNGKIYLIRNFVTENHTNGDFDEGKIIAEYDSTGTALMTDSNGYFKGFDNKFKKIVEEGRVKNGNKDGNGKGAMTGLASHLRKRMPTANLSRVYQLAKWGIV